MLAASTNPTINNHATNVMNGMIEGLLKKTSGVPASSFSQRIGEEFGTRLGSSISGAASDFGAILNSVPQHNANVPANASSFLELLK